MKTEKVIATVFLIAILFKLLHWPGGGPLTALSLYALSIMYFPAAFYFFSDKNLKTQNLALSIIGGLFLCITPIGIMFKMLNWPGAYVMIKDAVFTAPLVLIVTYLIKRKAPEYLNVYYKHMIIRSLVLTVLAFLFYLIPSSCFKNQFTHLDPHLPLTTSYSLEQVYTDPNNHFSMNFPKDWTIMDNYPNFALMAVGPVANDSSSKIARRGGFGIVIEQLEKPVSLEDYYGGNIENIRHSNPDFKIFEENKMELNGIPALYIYHQYTANGIYISSVQVYLIHNKKAYILNGSATDRDFMKYHDLYIGISKSFKLQDAN